MAIESLSQEHALRVRIRERIEAGLLPIKVPDEVRAGYGVEAVCVACDLPITGSQIEYEVDDAAGRSLHFHLSCYAVWQAACTQIRAGDTD